jgi:hypothetical protein
MKKLSKLVFYFVIIFFLAISLRGSAGNIQKTDMDSSRWNKDGPFELSPERGRFALTYSLVEDNSFSFDLPVARFAIPDLGYIDGKYVSLFAPGISFLIIPGYMLGKFFGISQLGSFAIISLFAVLNTVLIETIARKLGARRIYSIIAALTFLFATPAFTYAVTLYQHHISVFILLAGIWIYLSFKNALSTWVIWFLAALSFLVDYPNFFMMIPLMALAALGFFEITKTKKFVKTKFKFSRLLSVTGIVLPFLVLGWVNFHSYSDPLRLAGTVTNVRSIDEQGFPKEDKPTASTILDEYRSGDRDSNTVALGFFDSRNISNGLFIHLLSPDRGVIFFAPILIFALIGVFALYQKNPHASALLSGVGLVNLFIYSMWGDPWGGWAFGSRYLIPLYAVASIFLAIGLEKVLKRRALKTLFLLVLIYSVCLNTLGAITTSTNPPKVEILRLEELSGKEEKYTFERNWDYLNNAGSKSYIYNTYLKEYLSPLKFYLILSFSLSLIFTGLISYDLLLGKFGNLYFLKLEKKDIKDVITESKSFSTAVKSKIAAIENYISYNWNRKISLWKNL